MHNFPNATPLEEKMAEDQKNLLEDGAMLQMPKRKESETLFQTKSALNLIQVEIGAPFLFLCFSLYYLQSSLQIIIYPFMLIAEHQNRNRKCNNK